MKISAASIVRQLQDAGFEAYWVGGCVRDMLLGKDPQDFDIATDATPVELEKLFAKTKNIGKHFGVLLIEEGGHQFEVATFRSDGGYSDGRRPDAIIFSSAEEDAKRRDFTINAIFYDPIKGEIYDPVHGQQDLKRGLLRIVGNPDERLQEDFLRILRAVRFKNRFDLEYHEDTSTSLEKHSSLVIDLAGERIGDEMNKIITHASNYSSIEDLEKFGILAVIMPELTKLRQTEQSPDFHSEGDALTHSLLCLKQLHPEASKELRWATLLHDLGKADTILHAPDHISFHGHAEISANLARDICKRLKFSKKSTDKICWLADQHHVFDKWDSMRLAKKLVYMDNPYFPELLELHKADLKGCIPEKEGVRQKDDENVMRIENDLQYARQERILPSMKEEFLSGAEIQKLLNIESGPKIGEIKNKLREAQLEAYVHTKEEAIEFVKSL